MERKIFEASLKCKILFESFKAFYSNVKGATLSLALPWTSRGADGAEGGAKVSRVFSFLRGCLWGGGLRAFRVGEENETTKMAHEKNGKKRNNL